MLRKFTAALIATALVAGPALFAAGPAQAATPTAAAATAATPTRTASKPVGKLAASIKHLRKHLARHNVGKAKLPRHVKLAAEPMRHRSAAHAVKTAKTVKTSKAIKPSANTHG